MLRFYKWAQSVAFPTKLEHLIDHFQAQLQAAIKSHNKVSLTASISIKIMGGLRASLTTEIDYKILDHFPQKALFSNTHKKAKQTEQYKFVRTL